MELALHGLALHGLLPLPRAVMKDSPDKPGFPLEMAGGDLTGLFAATCNKRDIKYLDKLFG